MGNLIRITSNTLYHTHLYVCDCKLIYSIIFLHFGVFFRFLFRKMLTGNLIIFHHNFYFFVLIICVSHLRICVKLCAEYDIFQMCLGVLCYLFWFSFGSAEYSTIFIFVTYNAYQMQIQMSCLHPHVVLFLFYMRLTVTSQALLNRDYKWCIFTFLCCVSNLFVCF